MKILKMKLENFQGIKTFEFSPDGKNVSIYGDNGTGKTTLYNAFCWLWYGKASTDEKGYSPKTTGSHNLNHVVEIEIEDNGEKKTLRKDYHEVYKSKRGSVEKIFSGHTSDFYINDVPVQEKEFKKFLDCICTEEKAKLLTRYNYFLEDLKPENRREILLDVCGGVDEEKALEEFKELKEILEGKSVADYLKVAKSKIKQFADEEKAIVAQIEEAKHAKPEISISEEELQKKISEKQKEKSEIEKKLSASTNEAIAEYREELAKAKEELAQAKADYAATNLKEVEENSKVILELQKRLGEAQRSKTQKTIEKEQLEREITRMEKQRQELITEWQEVNMKSWEDGNSDICPTCGQKLPEEQIESAKKAFNRKKSERLEEISKAGSEVSKDEIEKRRVEIESIKNEIKAFADNESELNAKISELKEKQGETIQFEDTDVCNGLIEKCEHINKEIDYIQASQRKKNAELNDLLSKLDADLNELRQQEADLKLSKKQDERVAELEKKQKSLVSDCETYEYGKWQCDQFNRRKMELLQDKVNSRFKTLKFQLFEQQVNGETKDICEALIPCESGLVPFRSANNAARINAGLEMIDALSEHFGVEMPVWIDNCEGVSKVNETKCQQIRLYVSEEDKELRCKYE